MEVEVLGTHTLIELLPLLKPFFDKVVPNEAEITVDIYC